MLCSTEKLLHHIARVAKADNEVVDPVRGIDVKNMPKDRLAADFNHRLWAHRRLFADSRAHAAGEDDCFHDVWLSVYGGVGWPVGFGSFGRLGVP